MIYLITFAFKLVPEGYVFKPIETILMAVKSAIIEKADLQKKDFNGTLPVLVLSELK